MKRNCDICEDLPSIDARRDGVRHSIWPDAHCEVTHVIECDEACVCADGKHYTERTGCQCLTCIDMRERVIKAHDAANDEPCGWCGGITCHCDDWHDAMEAR